MDIIRVGLLSYLLYLLYYRFCKIGNNMFSVVFLFSYFFARHYFQAIARPIFKKFGKTGRVFLCKVSDTFRKLGKSKKIRSRRTKNIEKSVKFDGAPSRGSLGVTIRLKTKNK